MANLRTLSLCALASALLCTSLLPAQNAAPAIRIVHPVDESQLVAIHGTVSPLANAQNDRGIAPDSMQLSRMHLVLKRSDSQEAALKQLIGEMHTPGSSNYHKWLTPDQFGAQFGPSDQDLATVQTWLTGHGFNVTKVNPGRQTLEISGNVAQLRTAFHTQIHKYEVNGETHFANANDPQIPEALAPIVGGFSTLNNFRINSYAKQLGKATYDPSTDKAIAQWTTGNGTVAGDSFALSPGDYAVQYNLNPLYTAGTNGAGQSIAIINESNINIDLVNQFRSLFNLPYNPPQVIIDGDDPGVDGINNYNGPNGASVEAYLDVEWAGAVAPNATVDLVIGADTPLSQGLILAAERAVYSNIAPVMSVSFGNCEKALTSENGFLSTLWEQAAAQGITVLVSSGDAGSAGCDNDNAQYYAVGGQAVNGFASTPYNVAVGGTDFFYSDYLTGGTTTIPTFWNTTASNTASTVSIKGVIPEQPWNNSQYGLNIFTTQAQTTTIAAGGGGASNSALCSTNSYNSTTGLCTGVSSGYPKPSWQTGTGVPADGVRDIPDVSLFAANGFNKSFYPICAFDGDCQSVTSGTVQIFGVGGTSASTPAFAGIMALVNQKYGRQGQANTILYPMKAQFPAAFHDVTNGNNSVPCKVAPTVSPNCIAVTNPLTITDPSLGPATEGQIGTGTTPEYKAAAGYNLATGLGTVDANALVTNWPNVHLAATGTTLTPSSTSFTHGTSVTISGTVTGTGTPTGQVALLTDSSEQAQQGQTFFPLASGAFSGTTSLLPGGTYNVWGQYGGDTTNALSTSPKTSITVSPEASTIDFNIFSGQTAFTSTTGPGTSVDYGTQLMLSALVAPSSKAAALETCITGTGTCPAFTAPTGTVTFTDNGSTALNTALINSEGDAEYNAPFTVGAHSVTASFAGDKSYNASTASPITFTVVKDTPQIFLGYSSEAFTQAPINGANQPTVLTILIENNVQANTSTPVPIAAPTGSVTITSTPAGISGTVPVSAGTDPADLAAAGIATFVVPAGSASGSYNVTVTYTGDANYSTTGVSGTITVQSNSSTLKSTTTTATMTGSIGPNSAVTISGTVTGTGTTAPTNGVYIYSSGNLPTSVGFTSSSGNVSNYSVTLKSSTLFQGANFITVQYSGDATYNPSAAVISAAINNPLSDFTLIPATTNVPVAAGANATDAINLASINGFNGTVTLTCIPDPGVGCSISNTAGLSAGGSATATLTITAPALTANQNYNVKVVAHDASGAYIHATGIQAVVTGSTAGSKSFALTNSGNLTLDAGINAPPANTSTITVTPLGGFSGSVALTCAVTPAGSNIPTCAVAPASVALAGTAAQTAVLTVTTASTTAAGTYTVTVTGASGAITLTTAVTASVGLPTFALSNTTTSSSPLSITRTSSITGTTSITVTPSNGFTGPVGLTCVVTTAISSPNALPTCSVASPVTISGATPQTATLTVSATAATAMNEPLKLFWPSTGGAVLALVFFFGIPKRRRNWLAMIGLLVLFVSGVAIGCGGGGSSSGGGGGGSSNPGTTPGTYTVTVTGTSGALTPQTTVVTVSVQ